MIVPMYIISNGELAKEALNAVATLLGGNAFNTRLSSFSKKFIKFEIAIPPYQYRAYV